MSQSRPTPRNYGALALGLHALLAMAAFSLLAMFVPVLLGMASGEGAGMGVFLLLYLLGIPLVIVAVAATGFSLYSPKSGLLLPTVLLWLGLAVAGTTESGLAIVLFSIAYVGSVFRAMLIRYRIQNNGDE